MSQGDIVTISLALMAVSAIINTVLRIRAVRDANKPVEPRKAGQGTLHLGGRL